MSETYIVQPGDYMELIAYHKGFLDFQIIYNDANNKDFQTRRPNPNILYPGEKVFIPDKDPGEDAAATDKKHRYMLKAPKVTLTVYIRHQEKPFKNEKYTLKVSAVADAHVRSKTLNGNTGAKGLVEQTIPIDMPLGELTFATLPGYKRKLNLGFLFPITSVSGVQMRLNNLGFGCGQPNGAQSPGYAAALQAFQTKFLPQNITGKLDDATLNALRTEYEKGIPS